jgi:hypothetical protein
MAGLLKFDKGNDYETEAVNWIIRERAQIAPILCGIV